jgi:hypothetical protein
MLEPSRLTARTILYTSLITLGITGFVGYVLFQARFMIQGPQIHITTPIPTSSNERIVTVAGNARNITKITLNGRQIFTDEYGQFEEALVLENGYTIATIAAVDRYGRETSVAQPVVYTPATLLNE